jgi:hypothetical protein
VVSVAVAAPAPPKLWRWVRHLVDEQVDIQRQVASAWVLYAEGKYEDALKAMSAAADAEDKTDKHPVTPGVPTPARLRKRLCVTTRLANRTFCRAYTRRHYRRRCYGSFRNQLLERVHRRHHLAIARENPPHASDPGDNLRAFQWRQLSFALSSGWG